jgi:hypothetical protein
VRSDPGGQVATLGGFGVGVVAGSQRGHEQIRLLDPSGAGIGQRQGLSGMVDEQLVAAAVVLAQDQIELGFPTAVELAVAAVLVAFGIDLLVLLPQQLQRHVFVAAQLFVDPIKVGRRLRVFRRPLVDRKQPPLEGFVIQTFRQRPAQAGLSSPFHVVAHRTVRNPAAAGDPPVLQSQFELQSEDFAYFSHG